MNVSKIRFIEPGNKPYRWSIKNLFTYDEYIRTPSTGLLTLTTIIKNIIENTLMYSESISKVLWDDVYTSDIVFIGIFTFNANRGYEIAEQIRKNSNAIIVMGGLHASLNYKEALQYSDYVLLSEGDESSIDFVNKTMSSEVYDFQGIAYKTENEIIPTGNRKPPENINIIPDRILLYRYKKMVRYNTIWQQIHASRGCPHDCDYCAVVKHFGRNVRKRSVDNIIDDIKQSMDFHDNRRIFPRLSKFIWFTDDNFFADRQWAISVLKGIIKSGIKYRFSVQARFEVGFDDEMLTLLKQAGFFEIAMGIEFLEDEAFENYNKRCTYNDLVKSIRNIQSHGLNVRGLFIVGADNHKKGIGKKISDFVQDNNIEGVLIQSMYFIPGTQVYDKYKTKLIHKDWSKYIGNVVHFPESISPVDLQKEIVIALRNIYSGKQLIRKIRNGNIMNVYMFFGEFFWQKYVIRRLNKEIPHLQKSCG